MVTHSWFRNLWSTSKKHEFHAQNEHIAVLAFEAASLMTKLLNLWQSLTDKQVARLREEITNSEGVKKLVSENDDDIARLICAEMTENLVHVARAVSRLSKRCNDPLLRSFEQAFSELMKIGADAYGWQFSWKKMDRKVKKMDRFIAANTSLYQEMETLADLEQTLKRMKGNDTGDSIMLVECEKKVAWKRQEVKHLKENSLWNRTYDYTILLLSRSLFTIYGRMGHVFGINSVADVGFRESRIMDNHNSRRGNSTVFMQSSVYPSENCGPRFSGLSGNLISVSGPLSRANKTVNFHSGPLGSSMTTSSPISGNYNVVGFYSSPVGRSSTKSGPVSRATRSTFRFWPFRGKSHDARDKIPQRKPKGVSMAGPLVGCAMGGTSSPVNNGYSNSCSVGSGFSVGIKDACMKTNVHQNTSPGNLLVGASKSRLLNPPPETLGAAALALHYANLIIFIEKLVATPHLIGNDARDDLYNMLPTSIRAALRAKLKPFAKSLTSSVCDRALAREWDEAISERLEWLAPLAHNMIRWQSERSFEHQNLVSRTNVLLVQTLYFAHLEKTEAEITELLVGLNYIWKFGKEINAKSLVECNSGRTFDEYLD